MNSNNDVIHSPTRLLWKEASQVNKIYKRKCLFNMSIHSKVSRKIHLLQMYVGITSVAVLQCACSHLWDLPGYQIASSFSFVRPKNM